MMQETDHKVDKGIVLLPIARAAIAEAFERKLPVKDDADWLREQGASFVTLMQRGNLRGCIGTLEAHRSLLEDVRHNAHAAAFRDTRFSPLSASELDITDIEVSVLSPMQPLDFVDEADVLEQLRPGTDGVVLQYQHYRSTFLPQVWEQLPDPGEFMAHLKNKAGLPVDFWHNAVELQRYTVSKWKELDYRDDMTAGTA